MPTPKKYPIGMTIELHDGRAFSYPDAQTVDAVFDDLIAKGVTLADIKRTVHCIPKSVRIIAKSPEPQP